MYIDINIKYIHSLGHDAVTHLSTLRSLMMCAPPRLSDCVCVHMKGKGNESDTTQHIIHILHIVLYRFRTCVLAQSCTGNGPRADAIQKPAGCAIRFDRDV